MTKSHSPLSVLERANIAMNQHHLEAFLACVAEDYQSEHPAHPDRQFAGKDQVGKNWSGIFSSIPDFRSEMLRAAVEGNVVWTEWDWHGTRPDNTPLHMRGVTIFEVADNQIIWGRLYMDPVETSGAGIDANVRRITEGEEPH